MWLTSDMSWSITWLMIDKNGMKGHAYASVKVSTELVRWVVSPGALAVQQTVPPSTRSSRPTEPHYYYPVNPAPVIQAETGSDYMISQMASAIIFQAELPQPPPS